jgi:hypothetical protein
MKRYIDRIYSTKRQHIIDDEYESVGEMYKNKHHKKEPYIFTISASNSVGDSVSSDPTNDTLPYTVPSIPVITEVKPVNANPPRSRFDASSETMKVGETVSVNFNLLSGKDIGKTGDTINYKVSAVPANNSTATPITSTGTSSPIIVGGLTNGTEYIFTMTATNSVGSSLISNSLRGTPKGKPKSVTIKKITIAPDFNSFTIIAEIPKPDGSNYDVFGTGTTKYTPYIYDGKNNIVKYYPQCSFTLNSNNSKVILSGTNTNIVTAEINCVSVDSESGEINREFKQMFGGKCGFYIRNESDFCWRNDYIMNSTGTDINWIYLGKPGNPTITSTTDNKNGSVTINFTGSNNGTYGEAGLQVFNNLKYTLKTTLATDSSLPSGSTLPADIVTTSINPITVSGLVNGVKYIFTLYSTNSYIDTANSINKTVNSDSTTSSLLVTNYPDKITGLTNEAGTNLVKLKFQQPFSATEISKYKIIGYYTTTDNNTISTHKETIEVPVTSANYSIDNTSKIVTITLYTKSNNATFTLDSNVQGTTDAEKKTKQMNSAKEATIKTLNSSVQPYARVPLLYYPIGNEREKYCNSQNNKNVKTNNNIYYAFIIPIIFVILYFLMNMNYSKKIKTNKKF